ncbi:MAG: Hpt domain-containing protein, partial [Fidelibacterota bacterium]
MPTTSGLDVLREIKRDYPGIRVIIFTNYPTDQFKKTSQEYGADYFFSKDDGFVQIPTLLKRFIMENEYISQLIEHISESIVISSPSDLQAMGVILDKIEEIVNWAKENPEPLLEEAGTKISQLVKDIILEEVADLDATMEVIGDTLSAFQLILRDNKSPDDVKFPEALGLSTTDTADGSNSDRIGSTGLYHPDGLPDHIDTEVFADFLANQDSVLEEIESCILGLEQEDGETKMSSLKRILHTMKGEAGLIGLHDVEHLCHQTEDFIDANPGRSLVDPLLEVKDWLRSAMDRYLGKTEDLDPVETILNRLKSAGSEADHPEEEADLDEKPDRAAPAMEAKAAPEPTGTTPGGTEPFTGDVDLVTDFISEANEHLEEADALLLTLENDPGESSVLDGIFRAFHTLKGVAGFLDLKEIGELAHVAENLLDQARKGEVELTGPAMDITFESVDMLKRMIQALATSVSAGFSPAPEPGLENLIQRLNAILSGQDLPSKAPEAAPGRRGHEPRAST